SSVWNTTLKCSSSAAGPFEKKWAPRNGSGAQSRLPGCEAATWRQPAEMEFSGDAIVLGARGHGETGAIVHVLTADHGVFAAHIAGGASRRMKAALQPGARVVFTYRARHSDQLGSATLEVDGPTPDVLDDPLALIGLQCACAMTRAALPERDAQPGAFHALGALIGVLDHDAIWP